MRRPIVLFFTIPMAFAASILSAASPVIDEINDGQPLPNVFSALENVGWIYEPDFSYLLDGITSSFRTIVNPPVTTRDVTLSVYDDVPATGGNLLRTGTFSAGAAGGDLGIMFEPLQLEAGDDYFIGFDNLAGLGVNVVDFAVSLPAPQPLPNPPFDRNPDIDFQDGWYTGTDFATHNSLEESPGFAAPILRFHGVIPEPSTVVLAVLGTITALTARPRRDD